MAKAYYSSRLSENISKTPEGFLICRNVPIARTGIQEYLGAEIGMDSGQKYSVNRPETEVFSKAAMASFEGKPVCDEHPPVDVDANNYQSFMKGITRDVRRGTGEFADCLVADLIIYDKALADAIEAGKREISCGYDCLWVQTADDAFDQREIIGNHVAVVDKGRAGHKVAIRDQAPPVVIKRSDKRMSKQNMLERMFYALCKDAEPQEILEASKLVNKDAAGCPPEPAAAPVEQKPAMDAAIDERFKRIEDALEQLKNPAPAPAAAPAGEPDGDEEPDALDSLENELTNNPAPAAPAATDEDPVTVDPQAINEQTEDAEPEVIEPDEQKPAAPVPSAVRDAAIDAIQAMKPLIAQIQNPVQRRKAADSLAVMIRGQVRDEQYQTLMRAQKTATKRTVDSMDDRNLGKAWRDKYNPHYKKSE